MSRATKNLFWIPLQKIILRGLLPLILITPQVVLAKSEGLEKVSAIQHTTIFDQTKSTFAQPAWEVRLVNLADAQREFNTEISPRALIKFKTNQKPFLQSFEELRLPANAFRLPKGWIKIGNNYLWSDLSGVRESIAIPLTPKVNSFPMDVGSYESIWVDFKKNPNQNTCNYSIQMSGFAQNIVTNLRRTWTAKSLGPMGAFEQQDYPVNTNTISEEDFLSKNWKNGNLLYYVWRFLGLKPNDNHWELFKRGDVYSFRKRMHLIADRLKSIDLEYISNNSSINEVVLYLSKEDNYGYGKKLVIKPGVLSNKLGSDFGAATFDVHSAIKDALELEALNTASGRGGVKEHLYVQEIRINFSTNKSLDHYGSPLISIKYNEQPIAIPISQFSASQLIDRKVIDLKDLYFHRTPNPSEKLYVENLTAIISPNANHSNCQSDIKSIMFAKMGEYAMPNYAVPIIDWNYHLGGPSIPMDNNLPGTIESPNIFRYLPISSILGEIQESNWRGNFNPFSLFGKGGVQDKVSFRNYTNQGIVSDLNLHVKAGSNGSTIHVSGNVTSGDLREFSYLLNDKTGQIEIYWKVESVVPLNSKIFIGAGNGQVGQEKAQLYIESLKGSQSINVRLNQQTDLPSGLGYVKAIRIIPQLSQFPYKFNILDVAIFSPKTLNFNESLSVELPALVATKPATHLRDIDFDDRYKSGLGSIEGVIEGIKAPIYEGVVEAKLSHVYGLSVRYKTKGMPDKTKKCIAKIIFNWENGTSVNYFCPNESFGIQNLGTGIFAKNSTKDFGNLKSIKWVFSGDGVSNTPLITFDVEYEVIGWRDIVIDEALIDTKLFSLNSENFFSSPGKDGKSPYYSDIFPFARLEAQTRSQSESKQAPNRVAISENSLFNVLRVDMESESSVDPIEWRRFFNRPIQQAQNSAGGLKLYSIITLFSSLLVIILFRNKLKVIIYDLKSLALNFCNAKGLNFSNTSKNWMQFYAIVLLSLCLVALFLMPNFQYSKESINESLRELISIVIASKLLCILSNLIYRKYKLLLPQYLRNPVENYFFIALVSLALAMFISFLGITPVGEELNITLKLTRVFYFSAVIGFIKIIVRSYRE